MATSTPAFDSFKFLPQGGIIQEFNVAGHNIVLGFPSAESYRSSHSPFFGENIGRVANRIAGAKIDQLNGRSFDLVANNGPNSLHGGPKGWGKQDFSGPEKVDRNGREALLYRYTSPDGDEGFPGTVELRLYYIAWKDSIDGHERTNLEIEYEAELVDDSVSETVVNLTNHSYFNISGAPTITDTTVNIATNNHLETDAHDIPTGAIIPYPGIPSNHPFTLGSDLPAPDHCFVVDTDPSTIPLDTRSRPLRPLIHLTHPTTNLHLEALSTEPAFQFYAGKYINVPAMDGQPARGPRSGLCIEASRYVNAVNVDEWRHMVVLPKGKVWGSRTVYRAWKAV